MEIYSPLNSAEILSPKTRKSQDKQDSKLVYDINGP